MKIETAIKFLKAEYEKAKLLKFVHNPTAYALYQVWKMADSAHPTEKGGVQE